jgi:hypothetical protein
MVLVSGLVIIFDSETDCNTIGGGIWTYVSNLVNAESNTLNEH